MQWAARRRWIGGRPHRASARPPRRSFHATRSGSPGDDLRPRRASGPRADGPLLRATVRCPRAVLGTVPAAPATAHFRPLESQHVSNRPQCPRWPGTLGISTAQPPRPHSLAFPRHGTYRASRAGPSALARPPIDNPGLSRPQPVTEQARAGGRLNASVLVIQLPHHRDKQPRRPGCTRK
jgi:hypothetical protein